MKAIYFDMDGTIADLESIPNWQQQLDSNSVEPYRKCKPLVNMIVFNDLLKQFLDLGLKIGVISWAAKNGSNMHNAAVRKNKLAWIKQYCPLLAAQEFHVIKYGTPKHYVCKEKDSVLVDDNPSVRAAWPNITIDASDPTKTLEYLTNLVNTLKILKN